MGDGSYPLVVCLEERLGYGQNRAQKEHVQELIPHRDMLPSGSVQQEGIRNAAVPHIDYARYRGKRSICGLFCAALRIPPLSLCRAEG
ncbi:hypothetical protein HN588_16655 [Candidatus Bathyarchaeota archaeon]|nr:hypothetical protein [Candidatus Bathyarchaeota archaeon]